ncbi:unnamed protein product [Vitrella brassicaformis CCMP3155]|uniref:Uncharacterized protein n=2 Tax=Vitrella brassicaformis TaxID=1169539 RepID=A0A0G4E995_VITBC|nr:unnamed protein product [Vitrella brassicaformis CCMP3155]|eukprot:CEL91807.1 unnamed protein product [Vitrella brassicaformis CCMP3155]
MAAACDEDYMESLKRKRLDSHEHRESALFRHRVTGVSAFDRRGRGGEDDDEEDETEVTGEGLRFMILSDPINAWGYSIGHQLWTSSEVLYSFFQQSGVYDASYLKGKTVVELGSGLGLAGMTAAALGAKQVIFTDLPEGVELLERNVWENFAETDKEEGGRRVLPPHLKVMTLPWGDGASIARVEKALDVAPSLTQRKAPDVILGGDLCYDEDHHEELLQTILTLSGPETDVFLALPDREDLYSFLDVCRFPYPAIPLPTLDQDNEDDKAAQDDTGGGKVCSNPPTGRPPPQKARSQPAPSYSPDDAAAGGDEGTMVMGEGGLREVHWECLWTYWHKSFENAVILFKGRVVPVCGSVASEDEAV